MEIGIDFDGTCVTNDFPKIGKDIGAQRVLRRLVAEGHNLILFTMRCDYEKAPKLRRIDANIVNQKGLFLSDAKKWFADNEIPLYGVQCNPSQHTWTTSPKCYAHLYIDDAALGCPLIFDRSYSRSPFVNWTEVEERLEDMGFLKKQPRTEIRRTPRHRRLVKVPKLVASCWKFSENSPFRDRIYHILSTLWIVMR